MPVTAEERSREARAAPGGRADPGAEAALARFAAGVAWGALPEEVRARARLVLLDTIAHMLAGSRDGLARKVLEGYPLSGRGRARIIGTRRRAPAAIAGYLNGVTTTITQYDEGHLSSRGHPAINTVPAVLAVGDEAGASGVRALEALVTGYEIAARVGIAVGALRSGLHPHGMSGMIGAAAAAGKLLGFDETRFRHLLNAAATLTLFPQDDTSYAGATIHHGFIGAGVGNAIHATYAVAAGLTGAEGALSGFYLQAAGQRPEPARLTEGLGTTFEILRGFFKIYPACGHVGSPVEVLRLVQEEGGPIDPGRVRSIRIETYGEAARLADPEPRNSLAAKFSIPYCVAAYLLRRGLDLDAFGPEALEDAAVRALAAKVELVENPSLPPPFPAGRPSRVEVRLDDGSVREGHIGVPLGNHGNPVAANAVVAKAERLLAGAAGPRRGARLGAMILGLDRLPSIDRLTSALT